MNRLLLACLFLSMLVLPALADQPWPYTYIITMESGGEASAFMVPDGSGPPLSEARSPDGTVTDATITMQLMTIEGIPFVGLPREDMWLQWLDAPGGVTGCSHAAQYPGGMFLADGPSDVNGDVTFSLPLVGGGWSDGQVAAFLLGTRALNIGGWVESPLPLRVNSPDITGDRVVNLTDITLFVQDLGEYAYRSDYNWDGNINLTDVTLFAQAIGAICP